MSSSVGLPEDGYLHPPVEGGEANFGLPSSLGGGWTDDKALDGTILPEGKLGILFGELRLVLGHVVWSFPCFSSDEFVQRHETV